MLLQWMYNIFVGTHFLHYMLNLSDFAMLIEQIVLEKIAIIFDIVKAVQSRIEKQQY